MTHLDRLVSPPASARPLLLLRLLRLLRAPSAPSRLGTARPGAAGYGISYTGGTVRLYAMQHSL